LLCTRHALPLCRNASPDRRSVSGRISDYTVRNTWWRQLCAAHPREKRPGRIPGPTYFFLLLEFLERRCEPRDSTLLTLLRGYGIEGYPPLLYVIAFTVRTDDLVLLMLRNCKGFLRILSWEARQRKLYWGVVSSPSETHLSENRSRTRTWRQSASRRVAV